MRATSVPCPECGVAVDEECVGTFLWQGHSVLHLARVAALCEGTLGDELVALVDMSLPREPQAVTLHERLYDERRFAPAGVYEHNPNEVCEVVAEWLIDLAEAQPIQTSPRSVREVLASLADQIRRGEV